MAPLAAGARRAATRPAVGRRRTGGRRGGRIPPDARLHDRRGRGRRTVGVDPPQAGDRPGALPRRLRDGGVRGPGAGALRVPGGGDAGRGAGAGARRRRPPGVRRRTAPRLPHRGRGAAHRPRAHPHRRSAPAPVRRGGSRRSPLRRVHRRRHRQPPGEGGGRPARPDAAAGAPFPRRPALDRRAAGERVARRVPARRRARRRVRPAERALPRGGGAGAARPAALVVRDRPREPAGGGLSDGHEQGVPGLRHARAPGGVAGLRARVPRRRPRRPRPPRRSRTRPAAARPFLVGRDGLRVRRRRQVQTGRRRRSQRGTRTSISFSHTPRRSTCRAGC